MKNTSFVVFILTFFQITAESQPCLYEGIAFYSQASVDNFQINYPGCTQIEGSVVINGDDINNLNGLNVLTSIGGYLWIMSNSSLANLSGLDGLASIGDYLEIRENDALSTLDGLEGLSSLGGDLYINYNNSITSLAALENLTSVGGNLGLAYNPSLVSLDGLDYLISIAGYLNLGSNNSLGDLTALYNLNSIGGALNIYYNPVLPSLAGLDNIQGSSITELHIFHNNYLPTCDVKSVCDYLADPNGAKEIHDNATGCNSPEEVIEACEVGLVENTTGDFCTLYPNPTNGISDFIIQIPYPGKASLKIYNLDGLEVITVIDERLSAGSHLVTWNAENLPSGIYFYRLSATDNWQSAIGKIVLVKRKENLFFLTLDNN